MFAVKFIGACILVISTSLYGFSLSGTYLKRIESLKELKKCIVLLDGEMRYNKTPIKIAMEKISKRNTSVYSGFLKKVADIMEEDVSMQLSQAWEQGVMELTEGDVVLSESDKHKLLEFGRTIGNLDSDSRMAAFEGYLNELEIDLCECNKDKENKVKLYKTMGIMAGLFIAILIV